MKTYNCKKAMVLCLIFDKHGMLLGSGRNYQLAEVDKCPRVPGEGYSQCQSLCKQPAHAEVNALANLASMDEPHRVEIYGHTRCCDTCQELLDAAGVKDITFYPG